MRTNRLLRTALLFVMMVPLTIMADDVTVTFKANGGVGDDYYQTIQAGARRHLKSLKVIGFYKEDVGGVSYGFVHWCLDAECAQPAYNDGANVVLDEDLTLYARWAPVVHVTFKPNGGVGDDFVQNAFVNIGTALTPSAMIGFERENYILVSWNTQADGNGTSYSDMGGVTLTEDLTLYAVWAPSVNITFKANGGNGSDYVQTIRKGVATNLAQLGRIGFYKNDENEVPFGFVNWSTNASGGGTTYSDGQEVTLNSNITLYANWRQVTVTFDPWDGNGTPFTQKMPYNYPTCLAPNTFTHDDVGGNQYYFLAWHTENAETGGDYYGDQESVTLTSDLNLYARWYNTGMSFFYKWTSAPAANTVYSSAYIRVDADITMNGPVYLAGGTSIVAVVDLNGHTLTAKPGERLFNVEGTEGKGNVVIITDSSPDKSGKIRGGSAPAGGAIRVDNARLVMTAGQIIQCTATGEPDVSAGFYDIGGGAIYVKKGAFTMAGGIIGDMPVSDTCYIVGTPGGGTIMLDFDSPNKNVAYEGGGVYSDSSFVHIHGGKIIGNESLTYTNKWYSQEYCNAGGGAVYSSGPVVMDGGELSHNIQADGAIEIEGDYASFLCTGGLIYHNIAFALNEEPSNFGNGGAVFTHETGDSPINVSQNAEWSYNIACRYGGAYHLLCSYNVNFTGGHFHHNRALRDDAGAVMVDAAYAEFANCVFEHNYCGNDGGAIFTRNGITIREGTVLNNNYACNNGGGLCNDAGDYTNIAMLMQGGTMTNNEATYGGGVYLRSANFNMTGGSIGGADNGNTASESGGGVYIDNGKAVLSDGNVSYNVAMVDGGGIYVLGSTTSGTISYEMTGGEVSHNTASNSGGGVYSTNGNVKVTGGAINYNESSNDGGGLYAEGGNVLVSNNTLVGHNEATNHGGGIYSASNFTIDGASVFNNLAALGGGFYVAGSSSTTTEIANGANVYNNQATEGAGAYVHSGNLQIDGSTTNINNNVASTAGGGIYMSMGTVAFNEATMQANTAQYGGGFYLGNGGITVTDATIKNNNSTAGNGGAFDIADGDLTVNNSLITNNRAPRGNGGGAYVGNGTVVFNEGTSVTYNTAINGGGLYVGGGSITYNNGEINHNTATGNGGGIYANADVEFKGGLVSENTARNGGGLYANAGTVDFSSGTFSQNSASGNGGGIYVKQGAIVQLSGNAVITKNHVPEGVNEETGHGGGVYLAGQMKVGRNPGDPQGTHSLQVQDNYENVATRLNNVFLPTNENVIELLSDLRGSTGTKIGFSVNNGFRKVVYHNNDGSTTSSSWLHDLLGGTQGLTGVIFDDRQKYMAIHVLSSNETFDHNYIYLWGCWISAVDKDPESHTDEYPLPSGTAHHYTIADDGTWHIYTKEGLAWFSSYVNGLNVFQTTYNEDVNAAAKAVMEADVDMSEFLWVPLGSAKSFTSASTSPTGSIFEDGHLFKGSFDGQGHVINGLDCRYINSIHNYGLFGKLVGEANVCNTFVDNYLYSSNEETNASGVYFMGGIAGMASDNSIISNCEARGRQSSPLSTISILGGIVGNLQDNATVHSSIGLPELAGVATTMGGIAGQTAAGNSIRNSYSNPKIGTVSGNVGGLVGTNAGTVENCYVRLQHATAPTNFYWFAAVNNGTVGCCYARNDAASDHYTTVTAATGSGTYGLTQLPYLYKHRDTQVAATNRYVSTDADADKQLMIVLNRWVDTINSKQSAINYTKWGRPWQESDAQKPLNDDYPILKMPVGEAVAAEAGDPYLYYGTVDNLLTKYDAAGDAIWMYRNSESVTGDNSTSAAKLYIAEDVALLNDNALKAYVGITLDNSAGADGAYPTYFPGVTDVTDWHMIATPLSDAPIGINYTDGDAYDFDYGHPSGMPYYRFYPKDDAKHGYFPSHRFGKSYPGSDATIEEGSYYNEWDFYSYYEPEYHWINFKRNSASHHHMEADGHDAIEYHNGDPLLADDLGNESRLVPGKGYFAATREETFLQCQGHLNNGAVTYNLTQTSGVPRHGYNLIGNPYQAYLNFDAFADANSGDNKIWTVAQHASYTILDEDELERSINVETIMGQKPVFYRTYLYRCSSNPDVSAGGFIHPHQGFFVRLQGDKASAQAQFAPDQRNATDTVGSKFRGNEHIDYPLVNLFAIEEDGAADVVTVELGRPDEGGAPLMQSLRVGNGKIWCHYDDKDYAIAYTQPGITEVGIRFETVEDTEYTMRWSTRNGEFSYLHLIDNKTGADVDCLTTDEYKFSASTSDYKSRFRLVFGYTGIEEDSEAETNENFAFMMNDALVVTGEGVLQVFDMTGRMVASQELHGVQTTVSLPNAANGVYVLRLTEGKQSRIQKMVISK